MVRSTLGKWVRPMSGSWLDSLLAPQHPDVFRCGMREGGRWRFRPSAVDPLVVDGVVTLRRGEQTLRLRPHAVGGDGPRPNHVLVHALAVESEEPVELSVPLGDVVRFGLTA